MKLFFGAKQIFSKFRMKPSGINAIIGLVIISLLLAACGPSTPAVSPTQQVPTPTATRTANTHTQTMQERIDDLLGRMTLDEKIGQMTQVEKNSIKPGDIRKYFIGSILSGGGGSPANNSPADWYKMVADFQKEALSTRLAIPILYGVDAVHGHGNLLNATIFPHNIGLGAANDPALMEKIGRATAEEMLATGIPWNFGPVVAIPQDIRWGRTYEGYSESTDLVTSLSSAYIKGLQCLPDGFTASQGQSIFVLATAKHFIGDGGTTWGTSKTGSYMIDQGDMQVDEATLRARFLPPYKAAIAAGAQSIMVSFSSWNGTKMHAQKVLLTDLLKTELGFTGFVVSDWQAIDQINPDYYIAVVTAINAGVDMSMVPSNYVSFIDTMKKAVAKGDISQARVDDAVRRILRAKFALGLFDRPLPESSYQDSVRSADHLSLARQAVRESLVLLKNENHSLPVDKSAATIFVAGQGANDIGMQSGGWTLQWQGQVGNASAGTTILDGIKASVSSHTQVVYSSNGNFEGTKDSGGKPIKADVGIVVVGEQPYAEGVGDAADLSLSQADRALLTSVRAQSNKLIAVILSGRPLVITDQLVEADGWVAAWLPGSEGAGVADVLFGGFPFTGKTPYSWPRSNAQLPINVNNASNNTGCDAPLFPFGYGLAAGDPSPKIIQCGS